MPKLRIENDNQLSIFSSKCKVSKKREKENIMYKVKTTSFILKSINYDVICKSFRVYIYTMNWKLFQNKNKDAFSQMHCTLRAQVIMRDETQYAYYMNTYHSKIYLCLPPTVSPLELHDYEKHNMLCKEFDSNTADKQDYLELFKVALRNFCVKDESDIAFTGKGKIFFRTGESYTPKQNPDISHQKVLGIMPRHNWQRDRQLARKNDGKHEKLEIFMPDNLTKLRSLSQKKKANLTNKKLQYDTYYKLANNGQTFIPLASHDLNQLKKINVFEIKGENSYKKTTTSQTLPKEQQFATKTTSRNKIKNISTQSEEKLKYSRSYVLNKNLSNMQKYLQSVGIDAEMQVLNFLRVSKGNSKKYNKELPITDYTVTLIDARLNKSTDFKEIIKALRAVRNDCKFVVKEKSALEKDGETERFLVIRDYGKTAFDENGPLKEEYGVDPYQYDETLKIKGVVLKTLVINPKDRELSKKSNDEENKKQEAFKKSGQYLQYNLPSTADLKRDLTISLNGLHIREILMRNKNILQRFPYYSLIENLVFLYQNKALFVNNGNLHIINSSDSDFNNQFFFITGRKYDAVEKSIRDYYSFEKLHKTQKKIFKGHQYIMVSKEFVIEITKGTDCRALFDTETMLQRISNRRIEKPIKEFMVQNDKAEFVKWNDFLTQVMHDGTREACYENLVKEPSKKESSCSLKSNGYSIILEKPSPRTKSQWDNDLSEALELDLRSIKKTITDWSKGILFDHENMQYMVGQKDAFQDEQERSNLIRGIIELDGIFNPECFFPLLEVSFIRYKQYTVLPFPFKLIEKWILLEEIGYKPS